MADKQLDMYLNHHLAGALAGEEALEHLEGVLKGTPAERVMVQLKAETAADRRVLEELMSRFKVSESGTQKVTAWLGEKMSRVRLQFDERQGRPLHLLEALEAVSLAIEGRRALWLALGAAAQENRALSGPSYELLAQRAEEQRQRVESLRLDAAVQAFAPLPATSPPSSGPA